MIPAQNKVTYYIQVKALTPVFVGSGQTVDPLKYTIQKGTTGKTYFHHIDLDRWVLDNAKNEAFAEMLDSGNYREIRRDDPARFRSNQCREFQSGDHSTL